MSGQKIFVTCKMCGKKLIQRMPNGLWHFMFGKSRETEESFIPVNMYIHGSLKMRCISRECRKKHSEHWNDLEYFPDINVFSHSKDLKEVS